MWRISCRGKMTKQIIKQKEWEKEGERRFGKKRRNWRFVCPNCNLIQSGQDFLDEGFKAEDVIDVIGFSCIGRWVKRKGCDWSLGGLLKIHDLEIELEDGNKRPIFEFDKLENTK